MVKQCLVCKELDYLNPDVTFHRFAVDSERRKSWCSLLGFEEGKVIPKFAEICSTILNINQVEGNI
ncbi:unnamed protein product [Psylliodes chrysocephalus]|uniref:Uncharacterized protein n=1 Tax=Psylliodes chrysocephalus TaxID=3402493 RepID=A0A9P0CU10_9CUCU|nr:unnamed protein product [Psylliodes chrysocephala]